jgi:hypothetical protein
MTTVTLSNQNSHTPNGIRSMRLPIGRLQAGNVINTSNDPRQSWRGFSFGAYWFSYYFYFTYASPSSAARQMMPG